MPDKPSNLPAKSSGAEITAFVEKLRALPAAAPAAGRGRLIFAMDATASREPTWDKACRIQGEMFEATKTLGGLEIQLVYYRGFDECQASPWLGNADALTRRMTGVACLGGQTQIARVLRHALKEAKRGKVNAVVFVGDCMEEDVDALCRQAGELGLLKVPVFVFHEGEDPVAKRAFKQIARLSGGAYCTFDTRSARALADLLRAVAVYAAGGAKALTALPGQTAATIAAQIEHRP